MKYIDKLWDFIKKHRMKVYTFILGLLTGIYMMLGG